MRANTCRHCRERNSNSQSGRSRLKRCWRGTAKPAPSVLLAADQKVVHLLARSKLRRQPAGLLAAARPSLGRIFRIPVFGKDLLVRTALAVRGDNLAGRSKLVQPLLKPGLFYRQFASQFRDYLFMELPQVIDGH